MLAKSRTALRWQTDRGDKGRVSEFSANVCYRREMQPLERRVRAGLDMHSIADIDSDATEVALTGKPQLPRKLARPFLNRFALFLAIILLICHRTR
jgi:hypothetical protein